MPLRSTIVLFNSVDEFLEELARDIKPNPPDVPQAGMLVDDRRIARRIVRVSNELRRPLRAQHRTLVVLASYVTERRDGAGSWRSSELVELREYAGNVWDFEEGTMDEANAATDERAAAIREAVRQTSERLGLECRGGSFQAVA